ncbi:hypothetical protein DS745_23145 [Anaerobacillus alkaliphilus]|uniref:Uncharacterized protein n=1 Tax=Anaerobacillus alkaliphilus TaxID=1548597 RepID=A0A4V1LFV4_9BACI|nr:hypothetical protein DS745_23145 [Anaerobacillus alkaliphilus]
MIGPERLKQVFQQANKPIIPTPPSKVLSSHTLETINTYCRYCFHKDRKSALLLSLLTLNTVDFHTVDKKALVKQAVTIVVALTKHVLEQ